MEATILEIQRMSTEDGPGLRTTVFFKGCSLKCAWCQNPESISMQPQVQWIGSNCIGCGICMDVCPNKALNLTPDGMQIDRKRCDGCGECTRECPAKAMELLGRRWQAHDLITELVKDRSYFEASGGGITASGGEPMMQAVFMAELFKGLKDSGIHTALDTCGQYPWVSMEKILPYTDMVLFDLKEIDPDRHKAFAGVDNHLIHENLVRLGKYIRNKPIALWVRTPIIPGATDTGNNIRGIGRFIAENLGDTVEHWELCAFNNLCRDKYVRLGLEWPYAETSLLTSGRMEELAGIAKESGVDRDIVQWSGLTQSQGDAHASEIQADKPVLHVVNACSMP
ncbi:MAG: glycyl-radical enzyme activating protein [Thermodesulfobacteriota bacterium]|nr:glycyl-radical enzyme activating protein [Thermodesulfobacteriota bacterium]